MAKFEEKYWDDALEVLQAEERKSDLKKVLLISVPALLITSLIILGITLNVNKAEIEQLDTTKQFAKHKNYDRVALTNNAASNAIESIDTASSTQFLSNDIASKPKTSQNNDPADQSPLDQDQFTTSFDQEDKSYSNKVNTSDQFNESDHANDASLNLNTESQWNQTENNPPLFENVAENQSGDASKSMLNVNNNKEKSPEVTFENTVSLTNKKINIASLSPRVSDGRFKPQLMTFQRELSFLSLDHKVSGIFLYAGNSVLTDYGSKTRELLFNPEFSLGYDKVITRKWSANASLSYFQINGALRTAQFVQTQLGLGYESTQIDIKTLSLHYLQIPVIINRDINERVAIGAGFSASFLLNTKSSIETSLVDNFSINEISSQEEWGYTGGYNSLNTSLLFNFEYRLNHRFTFQSKYQLGLNDITRAEIYSIQKRDRNNRLTVGLKYRFGA